MAYAHRGAHEIWGSRHGEVTPGCNQADVFGRRGCRLAPREQSRRIGRGVLRSHVTRRQPQTTEAGGQDENDRG